MDDSTCPKCGSTEIDGASVTIDNGTAYQSVSCNDCEAEWLNEYKLSNQIVHTPTGRLVVIDGSSLSLGLAMALKNVGISANESQEKMADFSDILCDFEKRIIKPVHHREAKTTGNKSDRKRNRANRWR